MLLKIHVLVKLFIQQKVVLLKMPLHHVLLVHQMHNFIPKLKVKQQQQYVVDILKKMYKIQYHLEQKYHQVILQLVNHLCLKLIIVYNMIKLIILVKNVKMIIIYPIMECVVKMENIIMQLIENVKMLI